MRYQNPSCLAGFVRENGVDGVAARSGTLYIRGPNIGAGIACQEAIVSALSLVTDTTPTAAGRREWDQEAQSYLGVVESQGRSPHTVSTYGHSLEAWARWREAEGLSLDPVAATRREAQSWVAHLHRTVAPGTGATRFAHLVTFYRWMVQEWSVSGEVRPSPFDHVRGPKATTPRVAVLPDNAMDLLLATCHGSTFAALRDRAIIALTVSAGLRRSEVASLALEDVDTVARMVRVRGKGDTDAVVPFGQVAADALRHYVRARARHRDADMVQLLGIRSDRMRPGLPLFLVDPRGGRYGGITGYTVGNIIAKRSQEAGLGRVHPHQLRHTFAHELLASGVSEGDVMTLGRWKSRKVMDRYGADLREARAAAAYVDPLARGKSRAR
jgi:integrase/recombinase XerC